MAYRVVYGPEVKLRCSRAKGSARLRILTAASFLALVLMVRAAWPEGTVMLRRVLLPQDSKARDAFLQMAEEIRRGEPVGDTVTAFCREIVKEALQDGQAD